MKTAALGLAFLALAGCVSTLPSITEGPAQLGQVALVGDLRVQPDRVIEDSRCPLDAQCVWAGQVVLQATVFGRDWSKKLNLTLGAPVPIAGGYLTLTSVQPERVADRKPLPKRLRFTFGFQAEPRR
jgi:hypothetical protein